MGAMSGRLATAGGGVWRALLACAGLLVASSVHAQLQALMDIARGSFVSAEKAAEQEAADPGNRTTSNLAPLCYAYYKLRRYNKLFACAAELDARVARGDTILSGFMVLASDASALSHVLRANAWLELGDPRRSLEEGERGLALIKDGYESGFLNRSQYYVEVLPALGIAAARLGRQRDAERYLSMLEKAEISVIGGLHRRNLRNVGLGMMYVALQRYDKALSHLTQGEEVAISRMLGDIFLGGGESFASYYELPRAVMIGKILLELGRIQEARAALDQVIAHPRAAEYGDIFWVSLYLRGAIAERDGKPSEAIDYYRRAIELIERQRASLTTEATKIGFVGDKQQVYARLVGLLVVGGRIAEAFDTVERSKARALVDMLAQKSDFAVRGDGAARTKTALLELTRAELDAQAPAPPAAGVVAGTRSVRQLQDEIRSAAPELSSLVSVISRPASEIGALLGRDEVLVEYYYDPASLYAFLLTPGGDVRAVKLERAALEDAVLVFRRGVGMPRGDAYRASAEALYRRLLAPLEPYLKAEKIVIVPHGVLHYLPFAALVAPDGRYLVDRHALRSVPSASVLGFLRPAPADARRRVLALGNPDLGDPKLDLAFAESEARDVAQLFADSRLLLRRDASETEFRRQAHDFGQIHFATHGRFRSDAPLDSGLYLAKDAENDGVLRVSELYSMSLNADLVTLSACETALGEVASGDDLVGLTRGFLYAGARSIVASLWSVDDRATAALMRAFYANRGSMDKREALRRAQIQARAAFPHPFFWGAFQLVGQPD